MYPLRCLLHCLERIVISNSLKLYSACMTTYHALYPTNRVAKMLVLRDNTEVEIPIGAP